MYADPTLDEKPALLEKRGGAFYSEAAVDAGRGPPRPAAGPSVQVVNLRNDGTLPFLPDDAVIEVPATVDASGATALPVDPLEPLYAGLVAHVTAYEAPRAGRRPARAAATASSRRCSPTRWSARSTSRAG